MPSKKTRVSDLPTDKAIRKLFPTAVVKKAQETIREREKPKAKRK